ncbi:MAG TPA: flagellar hook capping FlgD N-terminal domain-containing protein [Stellaceae bacterium]|jgi:flagellar basal-body rod modification protein FlgD|nr:flagellar hook capping FlgD N-terminal domain-containing protein [Stellaceae bacterium]
MTVAASVMPATVTKLPIGTQLPNTTSSASAAASGASSTLSEGDFLTLLTTQLENQDPLNPQNPSDFAAELAQFSTASGVQTLNTTLGAGGGVQAAGLVGKNVAVAGNALVLGSNGTAQGAFNLSAAAQDVKITITDASGSLVNVVDLGAMGAGNQNFGWNGQSFAGSAVPAGTYSYAIQASSASSANTVTATPYAVVPVTSVVMGGQSGPMLDLGGGLAPVALTSVQEVF